MDAAPQPDLFGDAPAAPASALPEGLSYREELISVAQEAALVGLFRTFAFKPFEFRGYLGARQVVSFGWRYDHNEHRLRGAGEIPEPLLALRETAAAFAQLDSEALVQVLVTEYAPGAPIGWHRDRPQFAEVVGVSFLSPCRFRLRRKAGERWERAAFTAAPRSAYVLRGPAREEWEHSIPPMEALRYSVTFRSLRPGG